MPTELLSVKIGVKSLSSFFKNVTRPSNGLEGDGQGHGQCRGKRYPT